MSMNHHEIARKTYALIAFTVFGFLFDRSRITKSESVYHGIGRHCFFNYY